MSIIFIILVLTLLFTFIKIRQYQIEVRAARFDKQRADIVNKIAKCISSELAPNQIITIALKDIAQYFPMYRVSYSTISPQGILSVHSCIPTENSPSIEGIEADLTIAPQYLAALKKQKILGKQQGQQI